MGKSSSRADAVSDVTSWFRSLGLLAENGRTTLPVLDRCQACRSAPGCGNCPGCRAGQVCHQLPPCPNCGVVQHVSADRLVRHPLHRELYGETPEQEVFETSNGALFLQSIAALGITEPVLGLEADDDDETGAQPGSVLVLSGWRRVLAARACSFATVPVRLVDPAALPRRADVDLVIVSANFQRQKTIAEIRKEIQVWKRAIVQASTRRLKAWEVRLAVANLLGVSSSVIKREDTMLAAERLRTAQQKLAQRSATGLLPAEAGDDESAELEPTIIRRLRSEQQPGDLRGNDIISALVERNEPLLSDERDHVIHESIGRAAQTFAGASIFDVKALPPLWPEDSRQNEVSESVLLESTPTPSMFPLVRADTVAPAQARSDGPVQAGELTIYQLPPDSLPFPQLPAVDLIIAAPSWLEPLARPFLTPRNLGFTRDWSKRLQHCLSAWRQAIRPGGRLLLIVPISTPLHPGLPVTFNAIEKLHATDWAIGGTLVLHDPNLQGPVYAVPHPDQVLAPKAPARLIITAAPVLPGSDGTLEEQWQRAWAAPLPGDQPRDVAATEEAGLDHLWKYNGPGRRSRWLPEFQPGLLYHLVRIFSRPDGLVFLPELGGPNLARGCLRAGRRVIAFAEAHEQISEVVERIQRDGEGNDSDPFESRVASSLTLVSRDSDDVESAFPS
ncbi:MAG TPA: hypothetical protein VKX96_09535 [Chloroflexota bacterium]|nr:hypothetical protein [Chloroflexota bacterium]